MPVCPPVGSLPEPTPNIERLAKYAKLAGKDVFRKDACRRHGFLAAVHKEIEHNNNPPYQCLTTEEAAFVEGWIYATEHEYLSNGAVDDANLLKAIKRHVPDPDGGPVPMTG